LDDDILKTWTDLCYQEIEKINTGESEFFRAYASTNSQEFFAVAVENFFERPEQFSQQHKRLYDTLVKMLNQDPLKLGRLS
jgi:Mlc titration factor MtfA (ptsG expression regulator)